MIERIINAEIERDELPSLSTLLLVLIPKADGGVRPVAIANTIMRMAKAYALRLGGDVFTKIFEEDKLQQGAAPAGPEKIIHSIKAAIAANPEGTAVLLSDISNAYNERERAKMLNLLYERKELKHLWRCANMIYASGPITLVTNIDGIRVALETKCTTGVIQGCSIGGNLFNLSINEDLKAIQKKFPQLSVQGLHDDITILATKRSDFGALIEAAIFMSPLLEEQSSRMNMKKTRFMYYGSSAMTERTTAAIKEAGITLVTTDSTTVGDGRKHHYVHGIPVGPNSEEIASMVLQDAVEKAKSLKKLTYLPVQDAMVVLRKTTFAMMNYITRCCTPVEARRATQHFDEEVLRLLCEIQRVQRSELTALTVEEMLSPLLFGGTGIVATTPITEAGIPFLASLAMALPTMRKIVGDDTCLHVL